MSNAAPPARSAAEISEAILKAFAFGDRGPSSSIGEGSSRGKPALHLLFFLLPLPCSLNPLKAAARRGRTRARGGLPHSVTGCCFFCCCCFSQKLSNSAAAPGRNLLVTRPARRVASSGAQRCFVPGTGGGCHVQPSREETLLLQLQQRERQKRERAPCMRTSPSCATRGEKPCVELLKLAHRVLFFSIVSQSVSQFNSASASLPCLPDAD